MPLYDHHCNVCLRVFDLLRPYHRADEALVCPVYGSDRVQCKVAVIALREKRANRAKSQATGACCGRSCSCASHGGQG